mgnify:CR=1 FL=1
MGRNNRYNRYNKSSDWKQNNSDTTNGDYDKEEYKFAPFAEGKNRKTFAAIKEKAIIEINKVNGDMDDTVDSLRFMRIKSL